MMAWPLDAPVLALYLCCREAVFVSGANLAINGVQHLQ
jgi:hypothetical protein